MLFTLVDYLHVFRLLKQFDFEAGKFSLFIMGYKDASEIPSDEDERKRYALSTLATLELTQYVYNFVMSFVIASTNVTATGELKTIQIFTITMETKNHGATDTSE